jgi:hypothetical protein
MSTVARFTICMIVGLIGITGNVKAQDNPPSAPGQNTLVQVPLTSSVYSGGVSPMSAQSTRFVVCPRNWKGWSTFVITGSVTSVWRFSDNVSVARADTCSGSQPCQFTHAASRTGTSPFKNDVYVSGTITSHTAWCSP